MKQPRRISRILWAAAWPFWQVGNALSSLGTRISFGPRPAPMDSSAFYELSLVFEAANEADADVVSEAINDVACGCQDKGWCQRMVMYGRTRLDDDA